MKAVLFDLDDTLYPEIDYVKSGFRVVASHLNSKFLLDENEVFSQMLEILNREGRGKVFDTLLEYFGIFTEVQLCLLVYLYRTHNPEIHLFEDTLSTLDCLRQMGLYLGIITDGMASVQRGKVSALGLDNLVDIVIYTDELGREYWKPSSIPYQIAIDLLDVKPSDAVYVGDNIEKDFLGANDLGMMTIQIKRQIEVNSTTKSKHRTKSAKYIIRELKEIIAIIEGKSDEC